MHSTRPDRKVERPISKRNWKTLFEQHNKSPNKNATLIPATFLRVTVVV